jgi:hypothetical protein
MAKISDVITKSVSFMLQSGTTLAPFWSGAYFSHSLSFRMTNPLKCHSEHTEESAFTGTFAESLYWSTNMNHYPSAGYLDIALLFS